MNIHESPVIVSMTANATSTACTDINVLDVLNRIRAGEWGTTVGQVRAATSKDIANAIKRSLPGVLFSGRHTVRRKAGLVSLSGLVCVDADHVENPAALRDQIAAGPHCVAAWLSPSATGVKALVAVDPARPHAESWRAVNAFCKGAFGLDIDPACKDSSRLCFVSADPGMFIAPGDVACVAYPVETGPTAVNAKVPPASNASGILSPGDDFNARGDVAAVLMAHGWTSDESGEEWTRPGKSSGLSATLGRLDDHPRAFHVFSSNAAPFTAGEWYPPLAVFTLLECNGDDALAASELQKRGYGTPGADKWLILPSACGPSFSESAAKIFAVIGQTRTLFMRGRVVHEVVNDEQGARLEIMTPRAFRSRLDKHGRLMAWRSDRENRRKLVPALCAEETASALLATTEARDLLPPVRAIVRSPTLALNGADELIVLGHGWNPQNGGIFVTGHATPDAVSLAEAVSAFRALFDDFDFQSPGDQSRAFAAAITPALKAGGLLNCPTPVEVTEADKSQAGKGFRQKMNAALYGETPTFITQKTGGVGSTDEAISAALLSGRPFVQFDNWRGKLDSPHLEAVTTAEGLVPCRVPHLPAVEVDVRPFTFSLTSNGVETTRDLANRCSIVRIRKRPEGYAFRAYPEGALLEHIKARQPYYLGAIYSIIGAWFMDGAQQTNESRHDFRTWARTLDWICRNVLGAAPLMDGHNAARDRVSDPSRSWLRSVAIAMSADNQLDREVMASALAELADERDIPLPNCRADVGELDRARAVGRLMAKIFADGDDVAVDNFVVHRSRKYSSAHEKESWHYQFSQQ